MYMPAFVYATRCCLRACVGFVPSGCCNTAVRVLYCSLLIRYHTAAAGGSSLMHDQLKVRRNRIRRTINGHSCPMVHEMHRGFPMHMAGYTRPLSSPTLPTKTNYLVRKHRHCPHTTQEAALALHQTSKESHFT